MISMILGGTRSGKSRYAQRLALSRSQAPVYFATSRYYDADHRARIERHQADRGPEWTLYEEPLCLAGSPFQNRVIVVDCITTWLSNWLTHTGSVAEAALAAAKEQLAQACSEEHDWIFVTNELGLSPHAMTELGRKFVDIHGFLNQELAARADCVTLVMAGLPLALKGGLPL